MSDEWLKKRAEEVEGWFLERPRFWVHLKRVTLYPYYLFDYWVRTRRLKLLFESQQKLALSAPVPVSGRNRELLSEVERETRINVSPMDLP